MKCKRCGECCRYINVEIPKDYNIDLLFLAARKIKIIRTKSGLILSIPSICPHLTENNLCRIYDNRPQACRRFPLETNEDFMPKDCAFRRV